MGHNRDNELDDILESLFDEDILSVESPAPTTFEDVAYDMLSDAPLSPNMTPEPKKEKTKGRKRKRLEDVKNPENAKRCLKHRMEQKEKEARVNVCLDVLQERNKALKKKTEIIKYHSERAHQIFRELIIEGSIFIKS